MTEERVVAATLVNCSMLASECYRLSAELRCCGVTPRARLMASEMVRLMLRSAQELEEICGPARATVAEKRLCKKVKAALRGG